MSEVAVAGVGAAWRGRLGAAAQPAARSPDGKRALQPAPTRPRRPRRPGSQGPGQAARHLRPSSPGSHGPGRGRRAGTGRERGPPAGRRVPVQAGAVRRTHGYDSRVVKILRMPGTSRPLRRTSVHGVRDHRPCRPGPARWGGQRGRGCRHVSDDDIFFTLRPGRTPAYRLAVPSACKATRIGQAGREEEPSHARDELRTESG